MPLNDGTPVPPGRLLPGPESGQYDSNHYSWDHNANAIFWCALWLSGLFLDVGADTTLDSVEDVGSDDWDEEKDESEGDGEKGDEVDDLGGRDSLVCVTLVDDSDDNDVDDWARALSTLTADINLELAAIFRNSVND